MNDANIDEGIQYVRVPAKAIVAILIVLNVYPLFLAVAAATRFPCFMNMFDELLEGIPLPAITLLMQQICRWLWILPIGLIIASLSLLRPREFPIVSASIIAVLSIASASLLKVLLETAIYMPMLQIIEALGV